MITLNRRDYSQPVADLPDEHFIMYVLDEEMESLIGLLELATTAFVMKDDGFDVLTYVWHN